VCKRLCNAVVTICTASLTSSNSTFCPHSVFMCFMWIWEKTVIISLHWTNRLLQPSIHLPHPTYTTHHVYCWAATQLHVSAFPKPIRKWKKNRCSAVWALCNRNANSASGQNGRCHSCVVWVQKAGLVKQIGLKVAFGFEIVRSCWCAVCVGVACGVCCWCVMLRVCVTVTV